MIYVEKYRNDEQNIFFLVKNNYSDYLRFDAPETWQLMEFELFDDEEGFFQRKLAPSILDRW